MSAEPQTISLITKNRLVSPFGFNEEDIVPLKKKSNPNHLAWFFVIIIGVSIGSCSGGDDDLAYADLSGFWVTDNPRYAGCALELKEDIIIFHTSENGTVVNFIKDIDSTPEEQGLLYKIEYKDTESQYFNLSLYFNPSADGGQIRFKHQKEIVWKRQSREIE